MPTAASDQHGPNHDQAHSGLGPKRFPEETAARPTAAMDHNGSQKKQRLGPQRPWTKTGPRRNSGQAHSGLGPREAHSGPCPKRSKPRPGPQRPRSETAARRNRAQSDTKPCADLARTRFDVCRFACSVNVRDEGYWSTVDVLNIQTLFHMCYRSSPIPPIQS